MSADLTWELARALGLPKNTTKAVLTLEVGKLPTIEVSALVIDSNGLFVVEGERDVDGNMVQRVAQAQFMIRLERFAGLVDGGETGEDDD